MRQSLFGFIALTVALGLFAVMDVLISNDLNYEKPDKSRAYLNFIRIDPADTVTNTKDRRIPEPPPPQDMPETPDFSAATEREERGARGASCALAMPRGELSHQSKLEIGGQVCVRSRNRLSLADDDNTKNPQFFFFVSDPEPTLFD